MGYIVIAITLFLSLGNSFSKEYVVAFPESQFFPQYFVKENRAIGFLPELLREFEKDSKNNPKNNSKMKLELVSFPVRRMVTKFFENEVDFIIPSNPQWLAEEKTGLGIVYSVPIMKSKVSFLIPRSKMINKLSDVKVVGTIRGYTITPLLKEIEEEKVEVIFSETIESLIKMAEKGRLDAIYFHTAIANQKDGKGVLRPSEILPSVDYDYHLATIKYPKIINRFNAWFEKNHEAIDRMRVKYLSPQK